MNAEGQKSYRVSPLGRLAYVFLAILSLPFGMAIALLPWISYTPMRLHEILLDVPIGFALSAYGVYCLSQSTRISPRFLLDGTGFYYKGFWGSLSAHWNDIDSYVMNYAGSNPMVFMHVKLKGANAPRWRKRLDLSGLSPDYRELVADFDRHMKAGKYENA